MDLYYNIDPSNRRYSEEELQEVRERYLGKQQAQAEGGTRSSDGRFASAWKAVLSLLSKKKLSTRGG